MKLKHFFIKKDIFQIQYFFSQINKKDLEKTHPNSIQRTINYLLKKRRESIERSMIRPLYQEVLKSIFFVVIILVDTLIPLQIYLDFPDVINIVFALIVLIIFLYIEKRIYNLLWGKKGRWSLDKYKKNLKDIKENTDS